MIKFEICIECGEETGRAGILEDSLYIEESGPFCENCYEEKSKNITNSEPIHEMQGISVQVDGKVIGILSSFSPSKDRRMTPVYNLEEKDYAKI